MRVNKRYVVPNDLMLAPKVAENLEKFLQKFSPIESQNGIPLLLHYDKKSEASYVVCHLLGKILAQYSDIEATLDAQSEDDVLYKLNRDITEDKVAYKQMEHDARKGRSFEDIVIEFDESYRPSKPLKIYGGQHRIRAITKAWEEERVSVPHGVRVYFALTREQKIEIATVNNTSIAVSNDLLDRMREQMIGPELRKWCQTVGLLEKGQDFSDHRDPDIPTVRIARTLVVNYHLGLKAEEIDAFHQPIVCKSGGLDETYEKIRPEINWKDESFLEMGRQFARLHKVQRERVRNRDFDNYAEFARKAFSYAVVAAWAYAAGLFQRAPEYLKVLYDLPDSVPEPDDPLNAKALSEARLKGVDPDSYRGLGTRNNPQERGRMLEVFLVLATKAKKKVITKKLANAAIQSYEAKRAKYEADKALERI